MPEKRWVNILLCIIFLFILLIGGWYLGQVRGELFEARVNLVTVENNKTRLIKYLEIRGSELFSLQQELEELPPQFENSEVKQVRHFNSLDELKEWLAEDDTDQILYSDEFNCIDFALQLQERALADGYILSTEVLPIAYHWANIAVVGDVFYVIEPQDDRIILKVGIK